jgi:RNA-directed DNA polymerase
VDLCQLLGATAEEIRDVIYNKKSYYFSYPIRKKNGTYRYIDAPTGILKKWQKIINQEILYSYGPHPISYGFAKNRNPKKAAEVHVGQKTILSIDLKNFFNSIKSNKVERLLRYLNKKSPVGGKKASPFTINAIVEILTVFDKVPQGAPTSPALSNLYMLGTDRLLKQYCDIRGYKVTRYADDITISNNGDLPVKAVLQDVIGFLRGTGLKVNSKKVRVKRSSGRMVVLGIVVNEKTNIPRESWRNFRALLHNAKVTQRPIDKLEQQQIRGRLEWYKTLNQKRGEQFLKEYGQLNFINT